MLPSLNIAVPAKEFGLQSEALNIVPLQMDTFFNWKCWDCNRVFASNKALDQHFKDSPVHKIFECDLCGQECVGTAALDKHTAVYHPPPYCGDCEREFVSQQALDQHYRDSPVHKIFECKECGEECFGAAALDEHMDAYHPPAICRQCDREFTSPKALMQHIQESSVHKVFECQECGAECIGKTALDDHMDICHSFACQQCDRQFGSEEALQQHFKDSPVHRIPAFRCADCDRDFVSQSALTQHLNSPVHVHRCEECDREFRTAASLQQHKNSPAHVFKCAPCNRTFASQAALDQHLQSRAHVTLPPMVSPSPDRHPCFVFCLPPIKCWLPLLLVAFRLYQGGTREVQFLRRAIDLARSCTRLHLESTPHLVSPASSPVASSPVELRAAEPGS
jgi:transcription elongation factor Elf1